MFKLEFTTDNAAFESEMRGVECARILRNIAARVEVGHAGDHLVLDVNGNKAGTWSLSELEEE